MQRGPHETGGAPADFGIHIGRQRPAHRAGKTGDQGDAGDRPARVGAVETHQRGKRGIVQTHRHAGPEDAPGGEQHQHLLCHAECDQTRCQYQVGPHQQVASAGPVNDASHQRPGRRHHQQRDRERAKHGGARDIEITRDRCRQNRRQISRRSPRQRLGGAEGNHNAALAGD